MNKFRIFLFLGGCIVICSATEPFKPRPGSVPYLVYYASRYRGICVGTLVARTVVLTAAVCVTNPLAPIPDTRPINVITATGHRHPRRGIRVQVTKILIPNLSNVTGNRNYLMQKSAAILLLKRKVPDILAEVPLRSLAVDYLGEVGPRLQDECFMAGWHFFYKGDKVFPVHRFLLQRNVRVQFVYIVQKSTYCSALSIKFQKALSNMGFYGFYDKTSGVCVRDGMYGAPLICNGKQIGMLMAPDAQWTNCTGLSNIVHLLAGRYLKSFMTCVSSLFSIEYHLDWDTMKKSLLEEVNWDDYDYILNMYGRLVAGDDTSSSSDENQ